MKMIEYFKRLQLIYFYLFSFFPINDVYLALSVIYAEKFKGKKTFSFYFLGKYFTKKKKKCFKSLTKNKLFKNHANQFFTGE